MANSENKIKRHCQDNMRVYHFVSRTKTRDKIAAMYNILLIYMYSSEKDTLKSVATQIKRNEFYGMGLVGEHQIFPMY